MKNILSLFVSLFYVSLLAQTPLSYYLPDEKYDENISTPMDFLGHQVGDWHLSHDKQYYYLKQLAQESDRMELIHLGESHEQRPMVVLAITTPENLQNLEAIRQERMDMIAGKKPVGDQKVVIYQGNSIHGNEPSGGNAAVLYAYYLAATQNQAILKQMDEVVIFLDPCFNPDGFNRFASWVNSHKNKTLTNNPNDREYNESWPRGRTNHYWFDLNRDWLFMRQPESQARVPFFQKWLPEILTDHHEMGTNATYFFQPGVPDRVNPITPKKNQELTLAIAQYHAKALDKIKSLYYTQESYDDFYYGKGSTFPDIHGAIGILFEQASSRGHLQSSIHGDLSFAFTIKNQLTTQFSTFEAAYNLKKELLDYKANFFSSGRDIAKGLSEKGYVVGEKHDMPRVNEFLKILLDQKIEVYKVNNQQIKGEKFEQAYYIPIDQERSRTVRGIFETQTKFLDSIFYDVSAWVLPHAFNLPYKSTRSAIKGERLEKAPSNDPVLKTAESDIGYIFEWNSYYSPAALYYLLNKGLKVKVMTNTATFKTQVGEKTFKPGSIIIYKQMVKMDEAQLQRHMKEAVKLGKMPIYGLTSGKSTMGYDVGSRSFEHVEKPRLGLLVGGGSTSYDIGEVWHLFDKHYKIPVSKIDLEGIKESDLTGLNVLVLAQGYYPKPLATLLKKAVQSGVTLITMRGATEWASKNGLLKTKLKDVKLDLDYSSYDNYKNHKGSYEIGGAIFETNIDPTHPLYYGYHRSKLPIFRNTEVVFEEPENAYAAPSHYTSSPLLAGYINDFRLGHLKKSPAVLVGRVGKGRTIALIDNPVFRDFWWGTNKILANAVFFGNRINASTAD